MTSLFSSSPWLLLMVTDGKMKEIDRFQATLSYIDSMTESCIVGVFIIFTIFFVMFVFIMRMGKQNKTK
jgi:Fe2+ transport system protein B